MAKVIWIVRIITTPQTRKWVDKPFLDCLRYASLISINETGISEEICFDLYCPKAIGNPQGWAKNCAGRMVSFGFNAVAMQKRII